MKFPLADPPFAQLGLSSEQCEQYERLATSRLLETVAEYETFTHKHKRAMNKKQWKAVKNRESLTVYKKRDGDDAKDLAASSSRTTAALPKLVAVGTIVGTLDEVMYGIVAPASECIKIKTSYVEDDVLDDMLLQPIQCATLEDPYKFLGVKWLVKASPSVGAWPRDFVIVEATGTHMLANGERIGYQVQHSVEIQDCHYLKDLGILRATTASCSLFTQLPNGTVDVYMTSLVEATGSLPERLALSSAAAEMIDCSKAIWCAQNKKLAWLMRDAAVKARYHNRQRGRDEFGDYVGTMKTDAKGKHCCALCTQKFSAFRTAVTCELCKAIVCSRCKTARKLTYVHGGTKVTKIPTAFCKNCITNANNMDSIEFARSEYVPPELLVAERQSPVASSVASVHSSHSVHSARRRKTLTSSEASMSSRGGFRKQASDDWRQLGSLADTEGSSLPASAWSMDGSEENELSFSRDSVEIDALDERQQRPPGSHERWETKGQMIVLKQPMPIQETAYYPPQQQQQQQQRHQFSQSVGQSSHPKPTQEQEMWMQMDQLRLQAENVYRITRQNNQAIHETQARGVMRYT